MTGKGIYMTKALRLDGNNQRRPAPSGQEMRRHILFLFKASLVTLLVWFVWNFSTNQWFRYTVLGYDSVYAVSQYLTQQYLQRWKELGVEKMETIPESALSDHSGVRIDYIHGPHSFDRSLNQEGPWVAWIEDGRIVFMGSPDRERVSQDEYISLVASSIASRMEVAAARHTSVGHQELNAQSWK